MLIIGVSFLKACDINRAWRPICESPMSPSSSAFGTNAATLSTTTKSTAPLLTKYSQISRASSPPLG